MRRKCGVPFYAALLAVAGAPLSWGAWSAPAAVQVERKWSPLELSFEGPQADESSSTPNPFLDYRLQVTFESPSGAECEVPGFFDGDGSGSGEGTVWKARFTPDEVGTWSWTASFRSGDKVAISLDPDAGSPAAFDGASGTLPVGQPLPDAEGFHAKGRLEYVGAHYLRFQDGTWFLKTGADSPENLLAYSGFDNVQDLGGLSTGIIHDYAPHVADWNPGEPEVGAEGSPNGLKGLVGALNYLSAEGVNSCYFLPMNLGGDGQDTTPFLTHVKSSYGKTHFDVSRLEQWNTVFEHAMRRGIQLQFVLSETEWQNEKWLDDGLLGTERKLFFRELVARFAHHNAIKWNLGEENDYAVWLLEDMADYLGAQDAYDHPIGVHTHPDDFSDYHQLKGDPRFTITSIQYDNALASDYVEEWRAESADAGQPWVIDMDENGTPSTGVSDTNAVQMRKEILYDVLFSGGNVEWYLGSKPLPLGGDHSLEDFRTRDDIWRYSRYAREVLESELEFWNMFPSDDLVSGEAPDYGGAEVLASASGDCAIFLPKAGPTGELDLTWQSSASRFLLRWYNPRTGEPMGLPTVASGGAHVPLGDPPDDPTKDWVVIVKRLTFYADEEEIPLADATQTLVLDAGPEHAFETYQILSSGSGVAPGTELGGILLPLNWDVFTDVSVALPPEVGGGFQGTLNANGRAVATLDVSAIASPVLIGLSLHHAFLSGPGTPVWASNAVPMKIVP